MNGIAPVFRKMGVDADLTVTSFIGAWELTARDVGVPDTLIISPIDIADWVLNLSDKFKTEGFNFKLEVDSDLPQWSWGLACGDTLGYGSEVA